MEKKHLTRLFVITVVVSFVFFTSLMVNGNTKTPQESDWDEDEYGPEYPIIWKQPVKGVIFEHKVHTFEAGFDCDSCHVDNFEMLEGFAVDEGNFTMAAMAEGKYCGACHSSDEDAYAFSTETRCTSCHIGVRGVKRLGLDGEEKAGH